MFLFTAIFVFSKLTILQGNYAEEISSRPDMTFSCKQNRKLKMIMFACHFVDPDLEVEKEEPTE